ncbi:glycosyltransferase family protein [Novosphingobium ovatum]|uniref:hypothetical protein n=1 Tax=Novosphingobium ovatum TaxID=1908523 RepID=UPI001D11BC52|nr:hypothetical protein [Novosphingobium ovatum]
MAVRDRRAPLTALVLAAAYLLIVVEGVLGIIWLWGGPGGPMMPPHSPWVSWAINLCIFGLFWRLFWRIVFTGREYGIAEGFYSIIRMPIANIVTIMAGRRAFVAYCRSLMGGKVVWDKTEHRAHPLLTTTTTGGS